MNNSKTKNIILAVLVVGLVGMTIAYAGLTQQLLINNNQVTVSSNWRVRFAPTVTTSVGTTVSGSTTGASYTSNTPIVTNDGQTITGLQATFTKPGDYVEVAFKVRNEGNIIARGQSVTLNLGNLTCENGTGSSIDQGVLDTFCSKLTKWVKHSDRTTSWSSYDELPAYSGSGDYPSIDGILRIEYPYSLGSSDIEAINGGSVVVTLGNTTLNFGQTDNPIGFYPTYFAYGIPTTSSTTDYTTLNRNVFLGLDTSGKRGVCIVRGGALHCFKENSRVYEESHMKQVFSDANCTKQNGVNATFINCDASDFRCNVSSNGSVHCYEITTHNSCSVNVSGDDHC